MNDKKLSKNAVYENKLKAQGFVKVTLWIPEEVKVELTAVAEFCRANKNHYPEMARSRITGRLAKAI
ncbi:hypothetical protein HWQ46_00385 [Shewanella sp. D64]|uniref:hypothetical protein n=1 Tax=unclassified Shewanella TaxID=196818 RepID=UPI0022BA23EA|nr:MULTISPECIES: hypothetical protein [unclassified Shewanella]MEC4724009.1 hypothetical protein [Shewanella sp. D64]MEC4736029.1 hypothetical protein [Shewanella sp. E94]WBJ98025.1 hypothetical protein HWQ47_13470 [Shewanella sp. MTB7]WBJ98036.1 hypothetical protein HWQ47_13525 [Shewanella sp. MTB7]